MPPLIVDRKQLKAETREMLRAAQVSPRAMTALFLGLGVLLSLADRGAGGGNALMERNLLGIFIYVVTLLLNNLLSAGYLLYCLAIRRGERAEYRTLFDGFTFAGKIIGLSLLATLFISLWSMLFVIPGIIAAYRYSFAMYNLLENPELGVFEALDMSKRQTQGYKGQLFVLELSFIGWNLLALLPELGMMVYMIPKLLATASQGPAAAAAAASLFAFSFSVPWMLLLSTVWTFAVQIFFLPYYHCTHLGYFDAAKSTSGIGFDPEPPRQEAPWSGFDSPDGL